MLPLHAQLNAALKKDGLEVTPGTAKGASADGGGERGRDEVNW